MDILQVITEQQNEIKRNNIKAIEIGIHGIHSMRFNVNRFEFIADGIMCSHLNGTLNTYLRRTFVEYIEWLDDVLYITYIEQ